MTNSYNSGKILNSGKYSTGGIAGYIPGNGNNSVIIKNVHNEETGLITSYGGSVGGIVGYLNSSNYNFVFGDDDNLIYNNANIEYFGNGSAGGIIGCSSGLGTITNVKNTGTIKSTNTSAGSTGGVIGVLTSGTVTTHSRISKAENTGDVFYAGTGSLGGIVGSLQNVGYVTDSKNSGNLTRSGGGSDPTGGIAGYITFTDDSYFTDLENTGNISITGTNTGNTGGILGYGGRASVHFTNTYNSGNITGENIGNTGGILGETYWSPYFQSVHNTGDITVNSTGDVKVGGILGYTENTLTFDGTINPDGTTDETAYNIYNTGFQKVPGRSAVFWAVSRRITCSPSKMLTMKEVLPRPIRKQGMSAVLPAIIPVPLLWRM